MSKYQKFIDDLKEETYNQEIPNFANTIKIQYLQEKSKPKTNKKIFNKLIYVYLSLIILCIIICIPLFSQKNKAQPNIKYSPILFNTVSDTYAFELGVAANIMVNKEETMQNLANNVDLDVAANQLHKEYTAIRQLIYQDKSSYEIKQSTNINYEEEMNVRISYNSFDLECIIYYNKTLKEIDDDEEIYNIDGIVVINNKEYEVIGETEKEKDETKTKLKIILTKNNYFIIEEEYEDGEQEFIYKNYKNNQLIQKSKLEIEVENKEIEIVITEKGNINGKTIIKWENNQLTAKVEYENYEGKIIIEDEKEEIKYTFVKEKTIIKLKIIKEILNNTNKTSDYFVY